MELHRLEIVHGGTLAIKTSHYKICHKRGKCRKAYKAFIIWLCSRL